MLQRTGGVFVRNQFLETAEEEYIKSASIKGTLKQRTPATPFQERTNQISSIMNQAQHQKLILHGYEAPSEDNEKQLTIDLNKENVYEKKERGSTRIQKMIFHDIDDESSQNEEDSPKQPTNSFLQSKVEVQIKHEGDDIKNPFHKNKKEQQDFRTQKIQNESQSQLASKETQKQSGYFKIEQTQINKNNKRSIFNLELDDSSEEENPQITTTEIKEKTQNIQLTKKQPVENLIQKQKESSADKQDNEEAESQKFICFQPSKFISLDFDDDESSEEEESGNKHEIQQQNQPQQFTKEFQSGQEKKKHPKTIFDDADLQDSDSDNNGIDTVRNQINEDEIEECLSIIKKINIPKMKKIYDFSNTHILTKTIIPQDHKINLVIKRNSEKNIYTVFDSETVTKIMRVEKKLGGTYIFMEENAEEKNKKAEKSKEKQIAKMKVNFIGTEFDCYISEYYGQMKVKKKTLFIKYQLNIFGLNGPRRISMIAPEPNWPIRTELTLQEVYEKSKDKTDLGLKKYQSKTPKWIPEINAYVLNMRGTAVHSSIKNCIMVDPQIPKNQYLIFGKKAKDVFNLQIKNPFTILQGVAFAISSFDKKIGCE